MSNARHADMLEATRLTRTGRLTEATALLQRALRSDTKSGTTDDAADTADGRVRRTIASRPDALDVKDPPTSSHGAPAFRGGGRGRQAGESPATAAPHLPMALQSLLDRVNRTHAEPGIGGPALRAPAPDLVPAGGRFLTASYRNQAGSRVYKLYIPSRYQGQALPLIVMLHGCTQSPDDFAAGTRMNALAEEHGCLVAYPAQPASANPSKCWNWFSPGDQQRGRGEPALISGITRQVMSDYAVDPGRVHVAGLSAGGAAAAIMGMTYPDLYAAIGVHSGLACGAASDLPSALAAMRQGEAVAAPRPGSASGVGGSARIVPTIVFHGDRDATVHPGNGARVIAQCRETAMTDLRTTVQRGRVPGGHAYSRTLHADASGRTILEQWVVHGAGHAWSGGSPAGSYTDPHGPDAGREMLRFFFEHRHGRATRPVSSN